MAVGEGMESRLRIQNLAPPLLGIAALVLAGCAGTAGVTYPSYEPTGYAAPSYGQRVYANGAPGYPGQPVYAPGQVGYAQQPYAPDDYMYYPAAEVYFSASRGEYVYREGDQWVHRREPPRGFDRRTPYVRTHYRDDPEHHHDEVRSAYPRDWRPYDRDRDRDRDRDDDNR